MRALTLTQPWAGLVASGLKLVENRPRKIAPRDLFGQRFAIHASREIDASVYRRIAEIAPDVLRFEERGGSVVPVVPCLRDWYRLSRDTSAVIAVATLNAEVFDETGLIAGDIARELGDQWRWFFGPVGYLLRDVRSLGAPVPCKGALGFWTLPADVARAVEAQSA